MRKLLVTLNDDGTATWQEMTAHAPPVASFVLVKSEIIAGQSAVVDCRASALSVGVLEDSLMEWDFGDVASKYNNLRGYVAGHIYRREGTYTITFKLTDHDGMSTIVTKQIVVKPDNRAASATVTDNALMLFEYGKTYDFTSGIQAWGAKNFMIDAVGNATLPKPVLRFTGQDHDTPAVIDCGASDGMTIRNVVLTTAPGAKLANGVHARRSTNLTLDGVEFLTCAADVQLENFDQGAGGIVISDLVSNVVDGLEGYGVWLRGKLIVILNPQVRDSDREHCIRGYEWDGVLIYRGRLSNTADHPPEDFSKSTINLQPGKYAYVHETLIESSDSTQNSWGDLQIGPFGGQPGITEHVVFDNVIAKRSRLQVFQSSHVWIRSGSYLAQAGHPEVIVVGARLADGRQVDDLHIIKVNMNGGKIEYQGEHGLVEVIV